MCDTCGCQTTATSDRKIVDLNQSLLAANQAQAEKNRHHIEAMGARAVNLVSSPGAGKTTLLERTIEALSPSLRLGVIEGDIETDRDAARIRQKGIPVVQLTTGGACHLDARLVHQGLHTLERAGEGRYDLIFIENVGNLVCPATFDLGEHQRIVLVSVPEGSDKPAKYPAIFLSSQTFVINKTDLLAYFDFSLEEARREALRHNPDLTILETSATSGRGMDTWLRHLRSLVGPG